MCDFWLKSRFQTFKNFKHNRCQTFTKSEKNEMAWGGYNGASLVIVRRSPSWAATNGPTFGTTISPTLSVELKNEIDG